MRHEESRDMTWVAHASKVEASSKRAASRGAPVCGSARQGAPSGDSPKPRAMRVSAARSAGNESGLPWRSSQAFLKLANAVSCVRLSRLKIVSAVGGRANEPGMPTASPSQSISAYRPHTWSETLASSGGGPTPTHRAIDAFTSMESAAHRGAAGTRCMARTARPHTSRGVSSRVPARMSSTRGSECKSSAFGLGKSLSSQA